MSAASAARLGRESRRRCRLVAPALAGLGAGHAWRGRCASGRGALDEAVLCDRPRARRPLRGDPPARAAGLYRADGVRRSSSLVLGAAALAATIRRSRRSARVRCAPGAAAARPRGVGIFAAAAAVLLASGALAGGLLRHARLPPGRPEPLPAARRRRAPAEPRLRELPAARRDALPARPPARRVRRSPALLNFAFAAPGRRRARRRRPPCTRTPPPAAPRRRSSCSPRRCCSPPASAPWSSCSPSRSRSSSGAWTAGATGRAGAAPPPRGSSPAGASRRSTPAACSRCSRPSSSSPAPLRPRPARRRLLPDALLLAACAAIAALPWLAQERRLHRKPGLPGALRPLRRPGLERRPGGGPACRRPRLLGRSPSSAADFARLPVDLVLHPERLGAAAASAWFWPVDPPRAARRRCAARRDRGVLRLGALLAALSAGLGSDASGWRGCSIPAMAIGAALIALALHRSPARPAGLAGGAPGRARGLDRSRARARRPDPPLPGAGAGPAWRRTTTSSS